ncbi:hypothetical protein [Niallia sp. 03133]|uniref:hypothetical protein n=1 Tax=Niallia sp. 03133 TaxID=3458060 RepID=UPI0040440398
MDEDIERAEEEQEEVLDHAKNTDPLSHFMFGTNYPARRRKEENPDGFQRKRNRGDSWIFGISSEEQEEKKADEGKFEAITDFLDQIDINLLMKNVDSFMTSANELKPLIKKVTPLIKKWIK